MRRRHPVVAGKNVLGTNIEVDSFAWFKFLSLQQAFKYVGDYGTFTVIKNANGCWYVKNENLYVGRTGKLLLKDLKSVDIALNKEEPNDINISQQLSLNFDRPSELMTVMVKHDQIKNAEDETWIKLDVLKNLGIAVQLTL